MELHELKVLQRKTSTGDHGVTVAGASVCARAGEVRTAVTAGRENGLVRAEPVKGTVLHVERHNADALAVFHDQIEREVLDEEVRVVPEGLAVQGVEEGMTGTVGGSSTPIRLPALAELEGLTTERTLVYLAFLRS